MVGSATTLILYKIFFENKLDITFEKIKKLLQKEKELCLLLLSPILIDTNNLNCLL